MFPFDAFNIAAIVLCFAYQMLLFNYSMRVLENGCRNLFLHLLLAAVNTTLVFLSPLYIYQTYIIITVVLYIEFKLLSKTSHRQVLCGAAMFAVHITLLHYTSTVIVSGVSGIEIADILNNATFNNRLLLIVFVLLISALLIVQKLINIKMVQRLSLAPQYSESISGMSVIFIFIISVDAYLVYAYPDFPYQMIYSTSSLVLMMVLIYFVFLYAINMLNLHKFKRFADQLDETYNKILLQKKDISQKIDRDDLTGLFNRKFISEILEEMFEEDNLNAGILFVDVNGLKYVNDNFGHNNGDKLIICIAKALNRTLRDDDVCARIGGDEFLAILTDITEEQMDMVKKRLIRELETHDELEDFPVSASIGSVIITEEMQNKNLSELLALADADMRQNKVAFYESRESRYIK